MMKILKTLSLAIALFSNTFSYSQDEFFALLAKIPSTGYNYPGFIGPHYHSYFIKPTKSNLGFLGAIKSAVYEDGTSYEFNKAGLLTKYHVVFESNPGTSTTMYTYNDKGQLTVQNTSNTGINKGKHKNLYEYFEGGLVTRTFIKNGDTTIYNITEDQIYNQVGATTKNSLGLVTKIGATTLEYDGRKRLVKINSPSGVENRFYNENNTLSRIEYKGGNKETYVSFRYDPKGKWIREKSTKSYVGNSHTFIDHLITLDFDEQGNWTKMAIKDNGNSLFSKTHTRVLTYY